MVLCALFFAVCAIVLFWFALTNDRGLVINGLIHMGPNSARVFLGVLCAASVGSVVAAFAAILAYQGKTHEVVVDDTSLSTPGPIWRLSATRTVQFADVTMVREQHINGQHFITLVTPARKVWVGKSMLADGAFDEIVALVRDRVKH